MDVPARQRAAILQDYNGIVQPCSSVRDATTNIEWSGNFRIDRVTKCIRRTPEVEALSILAGADLIYQTNIFRGTTDTLVVGTAWIVRAELAVQATAIALALVSYV